MNRVPHRAICRMVAYLFICFAVYGCFSRERVAIHVILEGGEGEPLVLEYGGREQVVVPDSLGMAEFSVTEIAGAESGSIKCGNCVLLVYMEAGSDFSVYINVSPEWLGAEFFGQGAEKNEWWNGKHIPRLSVEAFGEYEPVFLKKIKEQEEAYASALRFASFDTCFIAKLTERFRQHQAASLVAYPHRFSGGAYRPSREYIDYTEDLLSGKGEATGNNSLLKWIISVGEWDTLAMDNVQRLQRQMEYIQKKVRGQELAAFLRYGVVMDHLNRFGLSSLPEIQATIAEKITDAEKAAFFGQLYERWERLSPGADAPPFSGYLPDSARLTLADLHGRYVYLCIWDVYDAAALKEIKLAGELGASFHGKNIAFVAIAQNGDRREWEEIVAENELGGIQLYAADSNLVAEYVVMDAPRYLLIDPRGRMIEAEIPPPSEEGTLNRLRRLWPRRIVKDSIVPIVRPIIHEVDNILVD